MPDDNRKKKKKKGKNKNKKKGNENMPEGTVESLQFKVNITADGSASNIEGSTEGSASPNTIMKSEACGDAAEHNSGDELEGKEEISYQKSSGKTELDDAHSSINELVKEAGSKEADVVLISDGTTEVPSANVEGITHDDSLNPVPLNIDNAIAHTVEDFFIRHSDSETKDDVVSIDVQKSPWKVDKDVKEIVEHNKRVRHTKITKIRKVVMSRTEDGEEIEAVLEEEDDDDPEVIGEIGGLDECEHQTVELQRVTKKRRMLITKTIPHDSSTSEDGHETRIEHTPYEEESTITRKVLISQDEFGEDIETVIEEKGLLDDQEVPDSLINVPCKDESEDDEAALTPVEIPCTESEVDFAEILGPANDEHEEGIKQQEQYDFARRDLTEERTSDDIVETAVKTHFREPVVEEHAEIKVDVKANGKEERLDISSLDAKQPGAVKKGRDQAAYSKDTKLTEEQKQLLEEVKFPDWKSTPDDWVLVNFTANEIIKFAELKRLKPGWKEESSEVQSCCTMM